MRQGASAAKVGYNRGKCFLWHYRVDTESNSLSAYNCQFEDGRTGTKSNHQVEEKQIRDTPEIAKLALYHAGMGSLKY